jgi:hypothetical protein
MLRPVLTIGGKVQEEFIILKFWLFEDDFHEAAQQAWVVSSNKPFHVRPSNILQDL